MTRIQMLYWLAAWTVSGSILFLFARCLTRGRYNASVRHNAWTMALACVGFLPLVPIASTLMQSVRTDPHPANHCAPAALGAKATISNILLGLWAAGSACAFGRLLIGIYNVRGWKTQSLPFFPPAELVREFPRGIQLRIAVQQNPAVPLTVGCFRPVVLLPRCAEQWTVTRTAAVLYHELGHVRRMDHAIQLFALFNCAVHWFNPIFWWASRQIESEAEVAADDFAILRGVKPTSYATELLAFASQLRLTGWKCPATQTAMVKEFTLEERLRSIIDPHSTRGDRSSFARRKMIFVSALLGGIVLLSAPNLVTWLEHRTQLPASCVLTAN
jgi:beta-lactamase regulating signal transducer with metallopeptidase domain